MEWYNQITKKFVKNVANKYAQENVWGPFNIFPKVRVAQLAGKIAKFSKRDWLAVGDPNDYVRMGSSESIGDAQASGSQPFVLTQRAYHEDVSEDERNNYDNPFDPVQGAAESVVNKLSLVIAKLFVQNVMVAGIWANDVTPSTKWDASGATPVDDVLAHLMAIESLTGFWPNRLVMTRDVEVALATNSQITGLIKSTDDKIPTRQLLAKAFKVETVEVFSTVETTAKKGSTPTASNTNYMATKTLVACYTPDRATTKKPSAGIHPVYAKGSGGDIDIKLIPMPARNNSLRIEGRIYTEPIVMASDLGVRFYDVLS